VIEPETEPQTEPATEPTTEPQTEKPKVSMGFEKIDSETGEQVSGAVLRVINEKGVTVEQWTSNGSVHTITDQLIDGESYRLIEVSAPAGYKFADDVQFTAAQDVTITMADVKKPADQKENGSLSVTKQLTCYGNIIGAENQVFYVALYEDAACTHRVTEIMPLTFQMASSVTVTFDGLEPGKTYYLGEADVNGINLVSGQVDDGTIFTTDFIQGQAVTASAQAGASNIKFLNEFYELPDNFYREGELVITKKLVDGDGQAKTATASFYAGIFADPEFTTLSDQVSSNIVELQLNGTSEASATIKTVLQENAATQLYVTEVDANGTPVSQNPDFEYEVTVDSSSVSLDVQNTSAEVTIINKLDDTEPSDTQPSEDEPETAANSTGNGTTTKTGSTATSVKTGDNTPVELYTILLAAAAVILLVVVKRKRSRNV
jgi:hypothetical protein